MTKIDETAYPLLNQQPSDAEVQNHYTVSPEEWAFIKTLAQSADGRLAAAFHLKLHQRLGRFVDLVGVPNHLLLKVAESVNARRMPTVAALRQYDASATGRRHLAKIRDYIGVRAYGAKAAAWLTTVAEKAAELRSVLPDIINTMLEELAHHRYDLPSFAALDRIAAAAREAVHDRHYRAIEAQLTPELKRTIDGLLDAGDRATTGWHTLKRESRKPTNQEARHYLQHVVRLRALAEKMPTLALPIPKHRYFYDVAASLDASELRAQKPIKRYALAVIYIRAQYAHTLDDAGDIFVKMMRALENNATSQLVAHHLEYTEQAERLILQLKDMLEAFVRKGSHKARLTAIEESLDGEPADLITQCTEHLAYAGKNYLPFLLRPYGQQRSILMNCLDLIALKSASDDKVMERMLDVLKRCRSTKAMLLAPEALGIDVHRDLNWMSSRWRKHVVVAAKDDAEAVQIHRRYLELAILTQLKDEISTGDVFIPGGNTYDDFREQLVDDATLDRELPAFVEVSGMPATGKEFVKKLKGELVATSERVDKAFPDLPDARIVDGHIVLSKLKKTPLAEAINRLDTEISNRMEATTIVDVLVDVTKWLGVDKHFKRLAGTEGRVDDLLRRVVLTLFCYGCNIGPTELARCVKNLSRKQAAWLNLKYVNEETLRRVVNDVINAYYKLELPGYWGSGQSASGDGTKWTMRDNTIMSEFHIRYGGYGGIGYYIVSDTYVALYSRFITCGAYEGHYILDLCQENASDIRPTYLHGDTHAQNYVAFGLAPFLGAKLMPRIRRFKDLNLYRPSQKKSYKHIDTLFNRSIKWDLIERHYRDILRYAISMKLGRISPSTILRRFNNKSQKNKIHDAMHEMGAAYRTIYLLEYIEDPRMRKAVSAAANKSEAYNHFIKWAFFANDGLIDETIRHEQQKLIRYNHAVANMIMFHNVQQMQRILVELRGEGWEITPEMIEALGPYRTQHINRLGQHTIDTSRSVEALKRDSQIPLSRMLGHQRPGQNRPTWMSKGSSKQGVMA